MISPSIAKVERLTLVLPAVSLNDCMLTFIVSMGWTTEVAIHPEMEATKNGLITYSIRPYDFFCGFLSKVILKMIDYIPNNHNNFDSLVYSSIFEIEIF